MAKYTPGPFGPLKGKIGNLVASNWREIHYLKVKSKRSKVKPTEKKKNAQQAFGFISSWLTPLHQFLLIGFKDFHPGWDGRLAAQSYNRTYALIKTDEGFDIDYKAARFTYGELPGAQELSVSLKDEGTLRISWAGKVGAPASGTDAVMYILACPKRGHLFVTGIGPSRKEGMMEIPIPSSMKLGELHVQIAFKSLLNEKNSISQYAGSINFDTSMIDNADMINNAEVTPKTAGFCQSSGISGALIKRVTGI